MPSSYRTGIKYNKYMHKTGGERTKKELAKQLDQLQLLGVGNRSLLSLRLNVLFLRIRLAKWLLSIFTRVGIGYS